MNKKIYIPFIFSAVLIAVFLNYSTKSANALPSAVPATTVNIDSLKTLNAFFEKENYLEENWKVENNTIPRITFKGIGDNWSTHSNELPVPTKKSIFFRLMTPLALISNENILRERRIVESVALDSKALLELAIKYRILDANVESVQALTQSQRVNLLDRVDILPPSLAVVQAAEESGWGTSRFARKGNALFGQWDFSGNGMKPKEHRAALGNYGVARFDSPLASVEGYMFNINTNNAYKKLRSLRSSLRADQKLVKGSALAGTLDKYSERGEAYTEGLRQMIRFNKLETLDTLKLSSEKLIHLNNVDD